MARELTLKQARQAALRGQAEAAAGLTLGEALGSATPPAHGVWANFRNSMPKQNSPAISATRMEDRRGAQKPRSQ